MKILLVNKFHYLKGGSEKYYFELAKLLKEKGNEVAFFSMEDEKNIKTGDKEYFCGKIDLNTGSKLKALDIIYSKENYKKMCEAIEDFNPDIVHLNNFQRQLSASVVKAANDKKVPVVFTAHDVQAICPAITMLDSEGNICERCIKGHYINCFKNKCNKGSTLKSLLGTIEGEYYRNKKIYTEKIAKIVTPSDFVKSKFIEDGIDKNKIETIHNFINVDDYNMQIQDDGYALYVGRLSKEKGILNLIKAFKEIENEKLLIAGAGPEEESIKGFIKENKMENQIELLGFVPQEQVKKYISKARFIVVPSTCYENCPYSILETQSIGKPVIGARIGGIPELIENGKDGMLYKFDNVEELKDKMQILFDDKEFANNMGKMAKQKAEEEYSKENYYNAIMKIYKSVLKEENK